MLSMYFFWGWPYDFMKEADKLRRCFGHRRYAAHNCRVTYCMCRLKFYSAFVYYQTDADLDLHVDKRQQRLKDELIDEET